MTRKELGPVLLVIVACFSFFAGGVYVGKIVFSATSLSPQVKGESVVRVQTNVTALDVPGVHWIKAGGEPVCPDTHPIKAKIESYTGYFYTPEHKGYTRIKPMLCFANETFALEKAGFLKKY